MRVIADHIRALTFAIADGAVPGNEGRGYVLRRILRRAARYGRNISLKDPFLFKLVDVLSETMGDVFTELTEKKDYIKKVIKAEEESFNATLDRGIELFNEIVTRLEKGNKKQVSGEDAFKLYDTFGFPIDLTNVMAKEKGFTVEEKRFNELMDQQKKRARDASKDKFASSEFNADDLSSFDIIENKTTEFTGYDSTETESKVIGIKRDKENIFVILDRSPFYVESGGQIDDSGRLIKNGYEFKVTDLIKSENKIIHVAMGEDLSKLNTGDVVKAVVDSERRWDIMRNHSATHLLHTALSRQPFLLGQRRGNRMACHRWRRTS